jgi:type IV secretion system protein VirD4
MDDFFRGVLVAAAHYWWLIAIAFLVADWFKPKTGVDAAIDEFTPVKVLGGAKWADNLKAIGLFKGKGIPIGYVDGKPIHYPGLLHILTICKSRGGKGASLLLNAVLSVSCSLFLIDPKGELLAVAGHRRKEFGRLFIVDPYNIHPEAFRGLTRAHYNPLDCIASPNSPEFHSDCLKIASSFIPDEADERNKHFTDGARQAASGVIAALLRHEAPERRNLIEVARIFASIDELCAFSRAAMQSTDRFIKDKLACFTVKDAEKSRELFDIARTASVQLAFVQDEGMAETLSSSDFSLRDLKRKPGTTVGVCLPIERDGSERLYRVVTECFLLESLREGRTGKSKNRVLAVIDECAMMGGYMRSLQNTIGMGAGAAGIQLWCIFQSLVQLKTMFPTSWESFIQSCGVTTWWGCRSETDREYVSKLVGTTEVLTRSMNASLDRQTGQVMVGGSSSQQSRPMLLPHEVGEIGDVGHLREKMIAFVEGANGPILSTRRFYWKVCRGFRKNPYIENSK